MIVINTINEATMKKTILLLALLLCCSTSLPAQKAKTYIPWKNGKLVVSEEGRYLKHENGVPFFWLGETGWLMPQRLNRDEVSYYLNKCKDAGYNMVQVQVLNGVPSMNIYGQYSMTDGFNFKDINRKGIYGYWDHMDYIIKSAASRGIYIGMVCIWGTPVEQGLMNEKEAVAYGKFLAERYKDEPNIIWMIGGDIRGDNKTEVWDALANSIRSIDKGHLMTFHPRGRTTSATWFNDREWLDFNMFQSGHAQRDYAIYRRLLLNDLQKQPIKPVLDGEPRYENIPIDFKSENGRFDDFDVRMTLYQSMFSGACGYTYGCNEVWQMYSDKYSPMIDAQTTWKESLDLAGACDMIHFRKLCEAIDFFRGRPLQHLIERPEQTDDDYAVAYGGKDYVLFYMPYGHSITVNLSGWTQRKNVRLEWVNPRNGELIFYKNIETSEAFEVVSPTQGRGNDWVLIAR